MAFPRGGYQPNPWTSGAPPGQVMSGLMASNYQQPAGPGPQSHFAPNPTAAYNNLAGAGGINWNMPNGQQLRMGQQTGWQQQVITGNPRGNQRTPNKRNANWNDGGNQVKRQNKGPNQMNNNRNNNVKGNQNNNRNNSNRGGNMRRNFVNRNNQNNNNQKKRNQNQNNRGKQHHVAQKAAENLSKKQYPIKKATNTDVKNEDFDSVQAPYVIGVFGYCCKLCDVFLKDKAARNEHVKEEDHLAKFKVAEEEKKAKKLAKSKAKTEQSSEEKTETEGDKNEQANGAVNENGNDEEQNEDENENVENEEEEDEQADDSNVAENGNEDQDTEDEAKVDSQSEVTEESKNLQQSIQQDLSTEQASPQKKVNTPKNKPFINKQANRGKGARGGGAANRRVGNRGKRQN